MTDPTERRQMVQYPQSNEHCSGGTNETKLLILLISLEVHGELGILFGFLAMFVVKMFLHGIGISETNFTYGTESLLL